MPGRPAAAGLGPLTQALPGLPASKIEAIVTWAANDSQIEEVWIIGSRVKGSHRADSDLDLVLLTKGEDESERLGAYVRGAAQWKAELDAVLSLETQIEFLVGTTTGREAKRYGVCVYGPST